MSPIAFGRFWNPQPASACPKCGATLDASTNTLRGCRQVRPGDFCLCMDCGEVLRYREGLQATAVSAADLEDIDRQPGLRRDLARARLELCGVKLAMQASRYQAAKKARALR